jgi:hypothetical protein
MTLGLILNVSAVRIFHGKHAARGSDVNSAKEKG